MQAYQDRMLQDFSVADRVAHSLAERIIAGALPPGVPVRQDHIAAEFQTSHVPVREAFRKLEAQGLLESRPRRGVRVASVDPATVFEVTEMRAALEVLALRHAFAKLTASDLQRAAKALEEGEASDDITIWEHANRRFHQAIVAPCAMPRLLRTIDDLHQASARYLFLTWKELDWQQRSDDEHREILARLQAGDVDAAAGVLHRHIVAAGQALTQALPGISAAEDTVHTESP